jgi:carotenoid cleavage dioxygenase-like enzyme
MTTAPTPNPEPRTHPGAQLGWTSMEEEVHVEEVSVRGTVPSWLRGDLFRVTPALLDIRGKAVGHWFDGLAMINKFTIVGSQVSYTNRFLESSVYHNARRDGQYTSPISMNTDPCVRLGSRITSIFTNHNLDNTVINIARSGEKFVALADTPLPVEFDPQTLETLGQVTFTDSIKGQVGPIAHAHYDAQRKEAVSYLLNVGPENTYNLFAWPDGSTARRLIAQIDAGSKPSYMHSFAMTERFVVLVAQPLTMSMAKIVRTGKFNEGVTWDPGQATRLVVVDRLLGKHVGTYDAETFFSFHQINAFEDGEDIVIDLVAMNDASSIWNLELARLRDPKKNPRFHGQARRYRISPRAKTPVMVEALSSALVEFPQINPAYGTKPYRFAYFTSYRSSNSSWFDELTKVDVTTGQDLRWHEEGCFPGEPVFVQDPSSEAEDGGVLLSVVLDTRLGRSFLLVVDAATMTELARAQAPHHIGFNTHGIFTDFR